jgi:hypothetical protein
LLMLGFDDEVGERLSNGIDDHSGHLAAHPVTTTGFGPDSELRCLGHDAFLPVWVSIRLIRAPAVTVHNVALPGREQLV